MPTINQEMYEQREAFLLDLRDLKERIAREEPSCFGQSNETDRDLCQILREILQLEQGLTGGGVRPGSLYPPTKDHQARKSSVNERLINILRKNQ